MALGRLERAMNCSQENCLFDNHRCVPSIVDVVRCLRAIGRRFALALLPCDFIAFRLTWREAFFICGMFTQRMGVRCAEAKYIV